MRNPLKTLIVSAAATAFVAMTASADLTLFMRDLTGGSDGNPGSTTEAETILALTTTNAQYVYTDYSDTRTDINVSGGNFGGDTAMPNGATSGDRFVLQATAYITIPAGDWTIGFGSDDGGRIKVPGITTINEYGTNGDAGAGDDEIRFNGTRGHNWTFGTFTLSSPLVTTVDAVMFESGGGESFEVAFAPGHQTGFSTATWSLLADGVNGWVVQVVPFATGPFDFSDLVASNVTDAAATLYATVNSNLTSSMVLWDTQDMGDTNTAVWAGSNSLGAQSAGTFSGSATGLNPDTEYVFRFYGEDAATNGWSMLAGPFATALTAAQLPTLFSATSPDYRTINLTWQDNANTETDYILQRSLAAGGPYTTIATLAADTVAYQDAVDSPLTTFYYRLAATNTVNESGTDPASCQTSVTTTEYDPNVSLVAYWPLDDGPVGPISSGTTLDDIIDDPVGGEVDAVTDSSSSSFVFDSQRGRVVWRTTDSCTADAGDTEMNRDWTWSVWARSVSNNASSLMGTRDGSGYARLTLNKSASDGYGISFTFNNPDNNDGEWHHVVFRRTGNRFEAFVDGVSEGYVDRVKGDNYMRLQLGGTTRYASDKFNGYMSEAAIWAESLPLERIQNLAAGGPVILPAASGSAFFLK